MKGVCFLRKTELEREDLCMGECASIMQPVKRIRAPNPFSLEPDHSSGPKKRRCVEKPSVEKLLLGPNFYQESVNECC